MSHCLASANIAPSTAALFQRSPRAGNLANQKPFSSCTTFFGRAPPIDVPASTSCWRRLRFGDGTCPGASSSSSRAAASRSRSCRVLLNSRTGDGGAEPCPKDNAPARSSGELSRYSTSPTSSFPNACSIMRRPHASGPESRSAPNMPPSLKVSCVYAASGRCIGSIETASEFSRYVRP